jgi:hypothetical protein
MIIMTQNIMTLSNLIKIIQLSIKYFFYSVLRNVVWVVVFAFIVLKSVLSLTDVMLNVMVPYLNFFISNTLLLSPSISHSLYLSASIALFLSLIYRSLPLFFSYLTVSLPLFCSLFLRIFFHFLSLCICR